MLLKTIWLIVFFFGAQHAKAQQIIFSENFEYKKSEPAWQRVSGNWHIADVQELRIAPAENGYRYVLCSGGPGFVRLFVDIPDTVKARRVKLSFAYYTYANGPGITVEIEFHKKAWKDGLKGKPQKIALPVKGRWMEFQKTFTIPAEANQFWVTFSESKPTGMTSKNICIDNVIVSSVR